MLQVRTVNAISEVTPQQWDAVAGTDYPFTRHAFLHALELSGATGGDSGWKPRHILVYRNDELVAVMPSYLKYHSYGEYVFDWAWADACRQLAKPYYPKWLSSIPYTPVSGPRLCIVDGENCASIWQAVTDFVIEQCRRDGLSSWHILFPEKSVSDALPSPLLQRHAVHFQWHNRGYRHFDDFLAVFNSRKRKNLKKERRSIADSGITLHRYTGGDITRSLWRNFYRFYQMTYAKRSGHGGYLNQSFFELLADTMPENMLLVIARLGDQPIAGALNFFDSDTLYGRYWGCITEVEFLHFEACYYQGIEFCIERGLQRFDPGVQGEHKIQRGFEPTYTASNHWLEDDRMQNAVENFLRREKIGLARYFAETATLLPFKSGDVQAKPQ